MEINYKSREFSYNVRSFDYGNETKYFIYVYISCNGVSYQLSQKNDYKFSFPSQIAAKKKIMKVLKEKCSGTAAEEKMKALPIFDDGYQETLF